MQRFARACIAGAAGSVTTNLFHELARRWWNDAPRVDLLGTQAVAKACAELHLPVPRGRVLYGITFGADLLANAAYFALVGAASPRYGARAGAALGIIAGIGAVALPERLGLSPKPTNRSAFTQVMSVALYTAGGVAAGLIHKTFGSAQNYGNFYTDRHVVVTGGSRGLGFVLARQLLAAGARVSICGRSEETVQSASAALGDDAVAAFACDVRNADDCRTFIAAATGRNGPIDVLINNAGVIEVGPLADVRIEDFQEAMDTHFWGPLHMTLGALPDMRARGAGHIVNVSSIGGVLAVPHLAPYCASKFALLGLTQALSSELALDGITITSVVPGLMITGSPEHAIFKGRNRAEFTWFTLSDSLPLLSVPAETAARRILAAIPRKRAQVVIGASAKFAQILNALVPETTAALLRIAARLLPSPGGIGAARRSGEQSQSAWTRSPLTSLNDRAAKANNERPNSIEQPSPAGPHTSSPSA